MDISTIESLYSSAIQQIKDLQGKPTTKARIAAATEEYSNRMEKLALH